MADHRVDELRLRLAAPSSGGADLRGDAERFVAGILELAGDRLESRWPGRLIFVPRLPLHWNIDDAELSDAAAISRYADEIVASIGTPEPQPAGEPAGEREVVVFRDEAHWWASYLCACATGGERAWAYEPLRAKGIAITSLPERVRDFAIAVLSELAQAGVLVRMAGVLEPSVVNSLCELLGIQSGVSHSGPEASIRSSDSAALNDYIRTLPAGLPLQTLALIRYIEAVRTSGELDAAELELAARATEPVGSELAAPGPAKPISASAMQTQLGGLFYLLTLAMELEIAEVLWKACIPEQSVLAHCAAALAGPTNEDDPAVQLFAGVSAGDGGPLNVTAAQHEEVATTLVANLAAAVPRRSLASLPEAFLRVIMRAGDRMLVASGRQSPFPILVWPVSGGRDIETGLHAFLSAWPASAPRMAGTPSIAELEGRVRVRAARELTSPSALFLPVNPSPWTAAVLGQIVGSLCYLFGARAGADRLPGAPAFVERYLSVTATVGMTADEMTVRLPASRIDIALRRAGLDRDPGWIPWLKRTVRFVFEEDSPACAPEAT